MNAETTEPLIDAADVALERASYQRALSILHAAFALTAGAVGIFAFLSLMNERYLRGITLGTLCALAVFYYKFFSDEWLSAWDQSLHSREARLSMLRQTRPKSPSDSSDSFAV